MDGTDAPGADGDSDPRLCDFCRLPLSKGRETLEHEGTTYEFCSNACRSAMVETDRVFTEYHGFRRIRTGVAGLDDSLPQGLPRNSFVLLSNDEGARSETLLTELVWRTLRRDEPAVVVSFTEPPVSVVENFLALDWNVLPYLEDGQLHLLDCFTYRVSDRDRMFDRMNEWNRHIRRLAREATETVRDPSDVSELHNKFDACLESLGMSDCGLVTIDSLTEFGSLVPPVHAYDWVKDVRADVCKGRFVPVFAGATITSEEKTFPHDLGYAVDGLVDLQTNGAIVEDALIKRLRIRKMNGVLTIPRWTAYEFTAGKGLVTFDPIAEMDEAQTEADGPEGAQPDDAAVEETGSPEGDEAGDTYDGGGRSRPRAADGAADRPHSAADDE